MNISVWCKKGKAFTRKNLYSWFLESGIKFYDQVSRTEIENALYDHFINLIQKPTSKIFITEMAGWLNGKTWHSAEKCTLPVMMSLPCSRKKFSYIEENKRDLEYFFGAFAKVSNQNYRIIMLETMVYGILSSILTEEGWTKSYFLNFVLIAEISEEWFCRLYQVFDRDRYDILNAGEKKAEINKKMRELNDEILLLSMPKGKNEYTQRNAEEHMEDVVNKMCGQDISSMGITWNVNAALVVLNYHISDSKKAINIMTDEKVFSKYFVEMLKSNAVDMFLSSFTGYVEKHMQEVRKRLKKYEEKSLSELLCVLWDILIMFCSEKEINLHEKTQVENNQSFCTVLKNLKDIQEIDEKIVMIVQDSMCQMYAQEKYYGCKYMENCCYWDAEYYYIPTKIFRNMMKKNGISTLQVKMTLSKWKNAKLLISDGEGFTYRLRLDGVSTETYCLKKEVFDKSLSIEMKDLAKEIEKC